MAKKLNEKQEKIISTLEKENLSFIKEANTLLVNFKKKIEPSLSKQDNFWKIMNKMENSWSNYPFNHFSNYYCSNFQRPVSESFILGSGKKNTHWTPLTDEQKKDIEKQIPNYNTIFDLLELSIEKITEFIERVIAKNVIVTRLTGTTEKFNELKENNEYPWTPMALSRKEYDLKGSYSSYDPHLTTIIIPYHRQKMIKYDRLFKTIDLSEIRLRNIIKTLKEINNLLPFTELIPTNKLPKTYINVEAKSSATDSSIEIRDGLKIKGDSAIGKDAEINKK